MDQVRMNFWIDSAVGAGLMDLLIIKKAEDGPIVLLRGTASMTLPKLYRRWTEVLKKKRLFKKNSYTNIEHAEERGYTEDELKAVSAHLANALSSDPQFSPYLLE